MGVPQCPAVWQPPRQSPGPDPAFGSEAAPHGRPGGPRVSRGATGPQRAPLWCQGHRHHPCPGSLPALPGPGVPCALTSLGDRDVHGGPRGFSVSPPPPGKEIGGTRGRKGSPGQTRRQKEGGKGRFSPKCKGGEGVGGKESRDPRGGQGDQHRAGGGTVPPPHYAAPKGAPGCREGPPSQQGRGKGGAKMRGEPSTPNTPPHRSPRQCQEDCAPPPPPIPPQPKSGAVSRRGAVAF